MSVLSHLDRSIDRRLPRYRLAYVFSLPQRLTTL